LIVFWNGKEYEDISPFKPRILIFYKLHSSSEGDFPLALSPVQPPVSQASFALSSSIIRTDASASTGMLPVSTSLIGSRPPITKAIDVWALGVTLYCFVYGRCPFIADTEFELFNIIPRRQPTFPDNVPGRDFVDPELKDLLARLLEKDVYKRITLKEVKV
jgi:serine/threonine protein kinase